MFSSFLISEQPSSYEHFQADVSQDDLQALLHSLCFEHQIVGSAVSLPEPIYQSDEMAKRGRENFVVGRFSTSSRLVIPRFRP